MALVVGRTKRTSTEDTLGDLSVPCQSCGSKWRLEGTLGGGVNRLIKIARDGFGQFLQYLTLSRCESLAMQQVINIGLITSVI